MTVVLYARLYHQLCLRVLMDLHPAVAVRVDMRVGLRVLSLNCGALLTVKRFVV